MILGLVLIILNTTGIIIPTVTDYNTGLELLKCN